jgi:hypothetical protein
VVSVLALLVGACATGTAVIDVVVGDCFDDSAGTVVDSLELINCDQPHDNEVYANLAIEQSIFPGNDVLAAFAADACLPAFEANVGMSYAESDLDYTFLVPTADTWNTSPDRIVTCFLYSADLSKLSSSATGS